MAQSRVAASDADPRHLGQGEASVQHLGDLQEVRTEVEPRWPWRDEDLGSPSRTCPTSAAGIGPDLRRLRDEREDHAGQDQWRSRDASSFTPGANAVQSWTSRPTTVVARNCWGRKQLLATQQGRQALQQQLGQLQPRHQHRHLLHRRRRHGQGQQGVCRRAHKFDQWNPLQRPRQRQLRHPTLEEIEQNMEQPWMMAVEVVDN